MGQIILTVAQMLLSGYGFAIIIYIFSSWIPASRDMKVIQFIGRIVEPYLGIFRRIIPNIGMIDISPIVAIFVLNIVGGYAINGLSMLLMSLKI